MNRKVAWRQKRFARSGLTVCSAQTRRSSPGYCVPGINELMEKLNQASERTGTVMNSVAISLWLTA